MGKIAGVAKMKRTVFFISDGTGITAANLGQSLLTQFDGIQFETITIPYVNSIEKANQVVAKIEHVFRAEGKKPLVFATFVNPDIHQIIVTSPALILDFFKIFIGPLEEELGEKSSHTVGRAHGLKNYEDYMIRINAVNYTLSNDDGANIHDYNESDVILIGVSRCGKTPTCLYMALHFGLRAANYPLTSDDLSQLHLPKFLKNFRHKIFGLTIEPQRLHHIRQERRPHSDYSSRARCQREINEALTLFKNEKIPYLDTTHRSIEEIAAEIIAQTGVKKRLY
jgi:hypothetical protein